MWPWKALGIFWQPIWNLLEERSVLLLVNAHHIKQVPGRKTDVADCEWIADLLGTGFALEIPELTSDDPGRQRAAYDGSVCTH